MMVVSSDTIPTMTGDATMAATLEVIKNTPQLVVRNLDAMPRGLGLRYLECVRSHTGELMAQQWRRELPKLAGPVTVFVDTGSNVRRRK